jgi:hypothetical protein
MAAMSRADMEEKDRKPFLLYVDEFQNFATDSFCSILSEARKYGLGLVMAHQYIGQLTVSKLGNTSTKIRDAVFGNVGTITAFKIGAEDAEYMAKEMAPNVSDQDLVGISNYKAYIKMNIGGTTSRPFSLETIYDKTGKNDKIGAIIKEYARMKFARKREFVEQEITARIGIDTSSADAKPAETGSAEAAAPEAPTLPVSPATPTPTPEATVQAPQESEGATATPTPTP